MSSPLPFPFPRSKDRSKTDDRAHHARRDVHRAARTRVRTKDLDQIQDDMKPENKGAYEVQPIDEDKPGLGQHVSVHV